MENKITAQNVKPGQVFSYTWGYEQTNVDWYEIQDISKTRKSAKFRKIHSIKTLSAFQSMEGQSVPDTGNYIRGEGPFTKRLKEYEGELYIRMDSGSLSVWDEKPKRFSTYS